ncbi:MAG TPA: hypothetical protein VET24_08955 [Actinomycetota bacterium]|nr:hypothetical protein [Actinomycetota bacterium]
MLEITDDAVAVLERAYDAAGRFNPGVKIRVYRNGDQIQLGFADRPSDGDDVVAVGDMLVFVEGGISGTLEAQQPHDRLAVRENG